MNYKTANIIMKLFGYCRKTAALDDINFKLEETKGCECERIEDSVCELWVTLAVWRWSLDSKT